jgi:acetyltransferase-like isoleucine patch superfamily enzyme
MMLRTFRRWHDRFLAQNAAIFYQKSPSLPILDEWRQRSFVGFLRHLMRMERQERILLISVVKSWYRKQIFISQCSSIGDGLKVGPDPINVRRAASSKLVIGKDVIIYTPCEFVIPDHIFPVSSIVIGDGAHLGINNSFRAAKNITIGRNCLIGPCVRISDYNGHPLRPGLKRTGIATPPDEVKPVTIGDNVWIGENAFIQKGVHIGRDSIVGANSVVSKNVPEGTIVMGNPARVAFRLADLDRIQPPIDTSPVHAAAQRQETK